MADIKNRYKNIRLPGSYKNNAEERGNIVATEPAERSFSTVDDTLTKNPSVGMYLSISMRFTAEYYLL